MQAVESDRESGLEGPTRSTPPPACVPSDCVSWINNSSISICVVLLKSFTTSIGIYSLELGDTLKFLSTLLPFELVGTATCELVALGLGLLLVSAGFTG